VTALEIRLIAYGALVLALIGLGGWSGYRLTRNHYEAVIQADRAAQQQALTDAQQKVISAQNAQAAATQKRSSNMRASRLATILSVLASLTACASSPRYIASSCPPAPVPPPSLMQPAKGPAAIQSLQGLLEKRLQPASPTRPN